MELSHLKYFYEVARAGSFTRASRALRISQPSISKMIRQLESAQGVSLFRRGRSGVTLTGPGRVFFERCGAIFAEVEGLKADLANGECEGELAIAASDNLCNYVLPGLFQKLWESYPKVRIKLFNGTSLAIRSELLEGRAEVGLFFTPPSERDFVAEPISRCEFVVVCSSANKGIRSRADLSRSYYIGSRTADYNSDNPCARLLASIGVKPRLFFETNSQETQKRMAHGPWGYTVVPKFMVASELARGELRQIDVGKKLMQPVYFARRRGVVPGRPARELEALLRAKIFAKGEKSGPR